MKQQDKSYKTLAFMTDHLNDIKQVSLGMFLGVINELSSMANGGGFDGERDRLYDREIHTDQFFVNLLENLGYDKDGDDLDEDDEPNAVLEARRLLKQRSFYI